MRYIVVCSALLALGLGCAGFGGSVPVGDHLEQVCAASDAAAPHLALAPLDRPAAPLPPAPLLELRADGTAWIDGAILPDGAGPETVAERAVAARRPADDPPSTSVLLAVEGEVPTERAVAALAALHAVGLTWAILVGRSDEPVMAPPPPDPAFAEALLAALPADPAERATQLAARLTEDLRWCPGALEVFDALGNDPWGRCMLLADGLEQALSRCPFVRADRVVSVLQVVHGPPDPRRPTSIGLPLDPAAADPLRVAPGTPWSEVLVQVALAEPPPAWIVVQ